MSLFESTLDIEIQIVRLDSQRSLYAPPKHVDTSRCNRLLSANVYRCSLADGRCIFARLTYSTNIHSSFSEQPLPPRHRRTDRHAIHIPALLHICIPHISTTHQRRVYWISALPTAKAAYPPPHPILELHLAFATMSTVNGQTSLDVPSICVTLGV